MPLFFRKSSYAESNNVDINHTNVTYPDMEISQYSFIPKDASKKNYPGNNQTKNISFMARLRHGEYSLAKTYWVFGVLGGIVLNLIIIFMASENIEKILKNLLSETCYGIVYLILFFCICIYIVNLNIGLWRAAKKYTGPMIWSILTKIIVCISWISFFLVFVLPFLNS